MTEVSHIACPACKGAIGVTNVDRIIRCTYCNTRLLVENDAFIPEYVATATVDGVTARRTLQRFLSTKNLPDGLLKSSRFEKALLCYVPYHEFKTRRLGQLEVSREEQTLHSRLNAQAITRDHRCTSIAIAPRRQKTTQRETEMVLTDLHRLEPAIVLDDVDLAKTLLYTWKRTGQLNGDQLTPLDKRTEGQNARILTPSIKPEKFIEELKIGGFSGSVKDDTTYVEQRVRRIFYPLWQLRYTYGGRTYFGWVDGVSGKLLGARAPQGDKWRVLTLLTAVSLAGFTVGRALEMANFNTHLSSLLQGADSSGFSLFSVVTLLLFSLGGLAMVWVIAWDQFRFSGDIIHTPEGLVLEKSNSMLGGKTRSPVRSFRQTLYRLMGRG